MTTFQPDGAAQRSVWPRVVVGVAVCAWLVVALITLDRHGYNIDEVMTHRDCSAPLSTMLRQRADAGHGPLYFLVPWTIRQLGFDSEPALRLPSVLFGTVSVMVLFALVRSTIGGAAALAATLLWVVNPTHMWLSQLARPYALLVLLTLLAAWTIASQEDRAPRHGRVVRLAVLVALMLYTHHTAWIALLGLAAYLCARPRARMAMIGAVLTGALAFVPWLAYHWYVMADTSGVSLDHLSWVGPFNLPDTVGAPVNLLFGWTANGQTPVVRVLVSTGVCGFAVVTALRWRSRGALITCMWLVPLAALTALSLATDRGVVGVLRYLAPAAPFQMALIACGIVSLPRRRWHVLRVVCMLAILGACIMTMCHYLIDGYRDPVRQIAQFVDRHRVIDEYFVIVASCPMLEWFDHYVQGQRHRVPLVSEPPVSGRADYYNGGRRRAWRARRGWALLPDRRKQPERVWLYLSSSAERMVARRGPFRFDARTEADRLRSAYANVRVHRIDGHVVIHLSEPVETVKQR